VVVAADPVEAGLLRRDRLTQQLVGRELLVSAEVPVALLDRQLPVWTSVKRGYETSPHRNRKEDVMAELTTLEEKLAEVLGLAQAAQGATEKVEGLVEDEEIVATLTQMREEAEETERRCTEAADSRNGKKTAILEKAQETKGEATEMMSTYLGGDSDGLDGFEFLTMAEAGEVGHWAVLGKLNESANESEISELVKWALPIQERHFADVKDGSLKLAGEKDPYEES
jgi:flagellar biosynthesis/type III secretory pathway chaperone